jgi:hypothetical protein
VLPATCRCRNGHEHFPRSVTSPARPTLHRGHENRWRPRLIRCDDAP